MRAPVRCAHALARHDDVFDFLATHDQRHDFKISGGGNGLAIALRAADTESVHALLCYGYCAPGGNGVTRA